jgi:hypothetical protein
VAGAIVKKWINDYRGAVSENIVNSHSRVISKNNTNHLPATMKDLEGVEASSAAPEREADPTPLAVMRSTKLIRGARVAVMVVWLLSAVAMATLSYLLKYPVKRCLSSVYLLLLHSLLLA